MCAPKERIQSLTRQRGFASPNQPGWELLKTDKLETVLEKRDKDRAIVFEFSNCSNARGMTEELQSQCDELFEKIAFPKR